MLNPLYLILILLFLQLSFIRSQTPICTVGESPIVGDWGFKNISAGLESPWTVKLYAGETDFNPPEIPWTGKSLFYFCSDDQCGSPRYSLQGYYYAFFEYNQTGPAYQEYIFSQNITIPEVETSSNGIPQAYFLEYFLSSSFPNNNNNMVSTFQVMFDYMVFSVSTGVMVYGDTQRIQITPEISPGRTYNLTFLVTYLTEGSAMSGPDLSSNGFQLSGVQIKLEPTSPNTYLDQDLYVSVGTGSDITGNGTLAAPFSTLSTALTWAAAGRSIYLLDGVYCGYYMSMDILRSVNILSYSQSPDAVTFYGEDTLNIFRVSTGSNSVELTLNVNSVTIAHAYGSSNTPGGGALFIESESVVTFTNTVFLNNFDYSNRGVISMRGSANLNLINSVISNNSNSKTADYGPAISMLGFNYYKPYLFIDSCQILDNEQTFLVDQTDDFVVQNSVIKGTNQESNTLCAMMISRVTRSIINNSSVTDNMNCALCIIKSNVNISNSHFDNNSLRNGPGGNIYISQNSIVDMVNIVISNSTGSTGSAIFLMEYSTATISNSTISNVTSVNSLISSSDSDITFTSSMITQCQSYYSIYMFFGSLNLVESTMLNLVGGIFATQTAIQISDSTLTDIQRRSDSSYPHSFQECKIGINRTTFIRQDQSIYLSFTDLAMADSTVSDSNSFIFMSPLSDVSITGCSFLNNHDSSLFTQESSSTLTVDSSNFINNSGDSGSVLTQSESSEATFSNSLLQNNTGDLGGCFYLINFSVLTLSNCTAINNSALEYGGVFYSNSQNITINGGTYSNNSALTGGGVIFYMTLQPVINNITQSGNTAKYGPFWATPAASISLDSPFPKNITSGNTTFSGNVSIIDVLGQVVIVSDIKIYLQISGNTIVSWPVKDGIATFTPISLTGPIDSPVDIVFLSNIPDLTIYSTESYVDRCIGGQVPNSAGNLCENCTSGSYGYDGAHCIQCPQNAYCQNGNQVISKPGYWYNSSQYPITLYQCSNPSNCLLGNQCAAHTTGILCAQCDPGYYNWGSGCISCSKTSPIVYIAVIIGSILMVLWVQRSDSESGLMTVIVYFVQTLMVLSNGVQFSFLSLINLEFESGNSKSSSTFFGICPGPYDFYDRHYITLYAAPFLIGVLVFIAIVTFFISKILNCLKIKQSNIINNDEDEEDEEYINNNNNNNNNIIITSKYEEIKDRDEDVIEYINKVQEEDSQMGGAIMATPSTPSTPKSKLLDSLSDSKVHKILRKHIKLSFMAQQLGALIKLILNIYSPIAKAAFEMFFCEEIAGVSVLVVDSAIQCTGLDYHKAVLVSYSLLVVIVGFPLILMILLFQQRKSLGQPHVQKIYGVFILKYKDSFYFWDVILLLRRLLIVLMSMMEPTSNARSFLLVLITLGSVLLQFNFQPFKSDADNQLEFTSLALLFVCCVYLDNTIWQTIEQYVVITSSVIFLLHTIYIIYSNYRHAILDSIYHYLYIITSGKHGRKMIKSKSTTTNNPNNNTNNHTNQSKEPLLPKSLGVDTDIDTEEEEDLDAILDSDDYLTHKHHRGIEL